MADEIRLIEVDTAPEPAGVPVSAMLRAVWLLVTWPVRWLFARIVITAVRFYIFYFVQSDSKAKCPGCGIRAQHDIRWSNDVSALIHVCKRCFAVWSEQPVTAVEAWRTQLAASNEDVDVVDKDGNRHTTVQHAQREPQLSYTPTNKDRPIVLRLSNPTAVVQQKGGVA